MAQNEVFFSQIDSAISIFSARARVVPLRVFAALDNSQNTKGVECRRVVRAFLCVCCTRGIAPETKSQVLVTLFGLVLSLTINQEVGNAAGAAIERPIATILYMLHKESTGTPSPSTCLERASERNPNCRQQEVFTFRCDAA